MDTRIEFSIIISLYNTEKYIAECLDSLINQSLKEYEVIIINDGSTDSSLQKCLDISKKENKIKIISQENCGVSKARNRGIEEAKGKYILFVDSDDYLEQDMLERIKPYLKPKSLITFGYKKIYLNKEIEYVEDETNIFTHQEIEEKIILDSNIGGYICNKVFDAEVIKKNNIRFDTSIHYSEDLLFSLDYSKHCNELHNLKMSPYMYRMRKSSVSYNYINEKNASILDLLSKLIDEYNYNFKVVNKLKYDYLVNYYRFKEIYDKKKVRKDIIEQEKEIINNEMISFKDKIKYKIVYKNLKTYLQFKRIKSLFEKTYI